jgi:hypothetical protein
MKRLLTTCLLTFLLANAFAQDVKDQIEVSGIYGLKIFTPEKFNLAGHPTAGEIAYNFNTTDSKADYIRLLNIKSVDIAATYRSFSDVMVTNPPSAKGALGNAYAVLARLDIELLKVGETQLLLSPAFGLAYVTQTYFTNGNPIIGSHVNFASQAGLKIYTPISSSIGVKAGIDIFHFSNVAYEVPNYGVNSYNVSLTLVKTLNTHVPILQSDSSAKLKRSSFEISADIGRRGIFRKTDGLYRTGLYAGYSYRLNPLLSLKTGFDAMYYYSVFDPNRYGDTYQGYGTSYDRWRTGVSVGVDLWLGNLAILADYGHYLHFNSNVPTKWYWNAGIKYHVLPWLAIQGKGYFHHTQADVLGIGLLARIQ